MINEWKEKVFETDFWSIPHSKFQRTYKQIFQAKRNLGGSKVK
jgi:hypothetical protein